MCSSDLGYSVTVPSSASYLSLIPGKAVELFIHTHVREDALDLYGFASRMEKEIFLTLLTVNGVGPKMAIGIMSKVNPDELLRAVVEGDKDSLTQIPGIGKKTAERVVLELSDKIRKKMESGDFGGMRASSSHADLPLMKGAKLASGISARPTVLQDAKEALVGLGYREQDVSALLQRVLADFETPPAHAEELVKSALRQLL